MILAGLVPETEASTKRKFTANVDSIESQIPYEHLSPLQAAGGVVQKDLRPEIPRDTHPKLVELLHLCWQQDPSLRPYFSENLKFLQHITKMVEGKGKGKAKGMQEKE